MKLIYYKLSIIALTIFLVSGIVLRIQNTGPGLIKKITAQEAADKAVSYINNNILGEQVIANLINVIEDKEKNLYKLNLEIGDQKMESYVTMDGKVLFPNAIDLDAATATE
ncbi:MAG: hypothetical protein AAB404_03000 [Patescibacteria group bacterium]